MTRVDVGSIRAVAMLELKWQRAEKWVCDKCRSERLRLLEEKLQDALHQIDILTRKNKALEEKLQLAADRREVGRRDTVPGDLKGGECLVLGDSIIRNVGNECPNIKLSVFRALEQSSYKGLLKEEN